MANTVHFPFVPSEQPFVPKLLKNFARLSIILVIVNESRVNSYDNNQSAAGKNNYWRGLCGVCLPMLLHEIWLAPSGVVRKPMADEALLYRLPISGPYFSQLYSPTP